MIEAFFDLLKENPGKKIKITGLCQRAGLARRTFYSHFERIEDIPREYLIENWWAFLESQITNNLGKGIPRDEFALLLNISGFEYWKKQAECYLLLKEAGMESILFEVILVGSERASHLFGYKLGNISEISDPILLKYFNSFEANTFINLFSLWVETGMQQSIEEMAEIHLALNSDDFYQKMIDRFGKNR
jgi:AcrR family transcriptional regulator